MKKTKYVYIVICTKSLHSGIINDNNKLIGGCDRNESFTYSVSTRKFARGIRKEFKEKGYKVSMTTHEV